MATSSFDRQFVIPVKSVDRFIEAVEKPSERAAANPELNIDEELQKGRETLEKYFSLR